jgi:predicted TIM-barrel fold metal-dependent hydrolase
MSESTPSGGMTRWLRGERLAVPHSAGIEPPVTPAPAGATDCHIHIFDPRFPRRVAMAHNAAEWGGVADYRLFQRRLGLSRVVIVAPTSYGFDNGCLVDALDALGERARGIAVIRPDAADAELANLHARGVRGIRLYAEQGRVRPEELARYASRIADLGWHIQFVAGREPGTWARFEHALAALPCRLVVDHMGYLPQPDALNDPGFPALRRLLDRGNTWVKLSGVYLRSSLRRPPYDDVDALAAALARAAPERVLWGTDWPHTGVREQALKPDGAQLFDQLARWVPDAKARERVLVANPAEVYWREG